MMTLRTFDARMLMAQRQGKISFYMQHLGEEAVSCAFRKALAPGDMSFPTYRQAGLLIARDDCPMLEMMCQIYSNERDPLQGPAAAGDVFVASEPASSRSRAISRTQYHPGGGLGDGVGDQGRHPDRRRPGSATARRRSPTSTPRWSSPRLSARRSILNIVNNQWAISTFQGIAAAGAAPSRRAALGFGIAGVARRRQRLPRRLCGGASGRPSARARNLGPTLIECVTLSRWRAFDLRRSVGLPAEDDGHALAAGRCDAAPEEASDPPGTWSRSGTSRLKRRSSRGERRGFQGGRARRYAAFRPPSFGPRRVQGVSEPGVAACPPPPTSAGVCAPMPRRRTMW